METDGWKRTDGNGRIETDGWKRTDGNGWMETDGWTDGGTNKNNSTIKDREG